MRRYYVAITRAKSRLYVHTNAPVFDGLPTDVRITDKQEYDMPNEVVLQLSHKDVYLNYFKQCKADVLALRAGDELRTIDNVLYTLDGQKPVAMLSKAMNETVRMWKDKGYDVCGAKVRFVVAWRPKDAERDEEETAVALVDLRLMARSSHQE